MIANLNKALKKASDSLGFNVVKRMRPEYDSKWPINHFRDELRVHTLQVVKSVENLPDSSLSEMIEQYIQYPISKGWGTTPYMDDIYYAVTESNA